MLSLPLITYDTYIFNYKTLYVITIFMYIIGIPHICMTHILIMSINNNRLFDIIII